MNDLLNAPYRKKIFQNIYNNLYEGNWYYWYFWMLQTQEIRKLMCQQDIQKHAKTKASKHTTKVLKHEKMK